MRSIRSTIFTRLLVLVISFFLFIATGAYFLVDRAMTQFVINDNSRAVAYIAGNIRNNYDDQLRALDPLAAMPAVQSLNAASAGIVIRQFLFFENVFNSVHIYRPNGDLVVAERRTTVPPYRLEKNFHEKTDKSYIALAEQVMRDKRPIASETYYTSRGDVYQTYLVPILKHDDPTQVVGILSGGVFHEQHHLDRLIAGLTMATDNFMVVSDGRGTRVASAGAVNAAVFASISTPIAEAAEVFYGLTNSKAPSTDVNVQVISTGQKVPYFLLSVAVPEHKLFVSLGVSGGAIQQKRNELLKYLFLGLVISFVLSVIASAYMSRNFNGKMQILVGDIKSLIEGRPIALRSSSQPTADEFTYIRSLLETVSKKIEKDRYLGDLWTSDEDVEDLPRDGRRD